MLHETRTLRPLQTRHLFSVGHDPPPRPSFATEVAGIRPLRLDTVETFFSRFPTVTEGTEPVTIRGVDSVRGRPPLPEPLTARAGDQHPMRLEGVTTGTDVATRPISSVPRPSTLTQNFRQAVEHTNRIIFLSAFQEWKDDISTDRTELTKRFDTIEVYLESKESAGSFEEKRTVRSLIALGILGKALLETEPVMGVTVTLTADGTDLNVDPAVMVGAARDLAKLVGEWALDLSGMFFPNLVKILTPLHRYLVTTHLLHDNPSTFSRSGDGTGLTPARMHLRDGDENLEKISISISGTGLTPASARDEIMRRLDFIRTAVLVFGKVRAGEI